MSAGGLCYVAASNLDDVASSGDSRYPGRRLELAVNARILIVARDDSRAGPLSEGLDRLGWRTITARGPYAALAALGDLNIEAVIVDLESAGPDAHSLSRRLKAAVAPRRLPVIAIGEPAPQFLALSNALTRSGADVVGAFTAYTAFDYLHERAFDAVVLWAGDNQQEALSIAAGMRRNTRLFHIPALLYLKAESYVTMSEAFHRGVSDVASPETAEIETAKRVMELARNYRRGESIRGALEKARSSGLMDAATGLFTRDLFAAHLVRLAGAARERTRSLSICVLRVADKPDTVWARKNGWLDRAIPQIGSMVGRLVRVEDTAARLAPEVFALALPATNQAAGRAAAERIAAVIGFTAFDAGDDRAPFVCEFDIGVAQIEVGESAVHALERAAARALQRDSA